MSGLERASVAGLPGRRGGIAGHPGGDQAVRWPHRRPRIGAIAERGRGAACCCPPSQAKRYAGMKLTVFLGSIVLSLALWSPAGATTVFSTEFAGGIAGWAPSGKVDAQQGTLRLRGPASATRAVSTAGYHPNPKR